MRLPPSILLETDKAKMADAAAGAAALAVQLSIWAKPNQDI